MYQQVSCRGVEFSVDWGVVERLVQSYWRSHFQLNLAQVESISQVGLNPGSWQLPGIKNVEVPWEKVRQEASLATFKDMASYRWRSGKDMPDIARDVEAKLSAAGFNQRSFMDWLRDVQRANAKELELANDSYSDFIGALRFVRDASADVVAVGSTIATGGAAAALLSGSAGLKAIGTYQDSGSVGAAALYGVGSLVLGVFKVGGAKPSSKTEYALILADGVVKAGASLVAGDTFSKALEVGALKLASGGPAQAVFNNSIVKSVFHKLSVPVNIFSVVERSATGVLSKDVADLVFEKSGKKLFERGLKVAEGAALHSNTVTTRSRVGVVDEAVVYDDSLIKLAIINHDKGWRQGW